MTVPASSGYSGPYTPNGSTTAFPFTFSYFLSLLGTSAAAWPLAAGARSEERYGQRQLGNLT